ncbi:uncharacterized protein LOC108111900 [Drosophila eugracilis]|uniref:uncharacterized protein LOC108111900 n=1 Tax=Drosophila eugracilis TaxID=29029 RepID=UPI0007E6AB6E|nr:uncharacterized protein LOC108111900 [Drosophila eugracilis]
MDAAYVKFMMCQCLMNRADWGLAIGCMNVVYSFFLFQFWAVELIRSLDSEYYPVKWVLLYGFNVMFNVITMMRIVKRESISVFYWMCETGALLIFRMHHLYYQEDDFWLAQRELYKVSNIMLDAYIGISLLAMVYVMLGLDLEPDIEFLEEEMVNDCKFNPRVVEKSVQKEEEVLEGAREMEKEQQLAKQKELENDREMEELNRKATLKLADIEEARTLSVEELTPPIEPTAPEEEPYPASYFLVNEYPEPSAPPESQLSLDEEFFCEINGIDALDDQVNDISFDE